jgi:ParB-like chromosome segregation protein Spo0J
MGAVVVHLPTELVVRYRAVDREHVPAPPEVVDTPEHLDTLTTSIGAHGIQVPLRLQFNSSFGFLDGNHRIAVALRLGLREVPVEIVEMPPDYRRAHGRPMDPQDYEVLAAAAARCEPAHGD